MVVKSPRKQIGAKCVKHFDIKTEHGRGLVEQLDEHLLMALWGIVFISIRFDLNLETLIWGQNRIAIRDVTLLQQIRTLWYLCQYYFSEITAFSTTGQSIEVKHTAGVEKSEWNVRHSWICICPEYLAFSDVNFWTIWAWILGGFVFEMAWKYWFFTAAQVD